jgi:hypothetical protein
VNAIVVSPTLTVAALQITENLMLLRSIDYSFEAAVADVVDNSMDATAQNVLVRLITKYGD